MMTVVTVPGPGWLTWHIFDSAHLMIKLCYGYGC